MISTPNRKPFLSRLLRDRSGNTLAIIAAATAPLVAIVGSAVDIGRGYVTQSRLQQACDAGTLAARKKLGSDLPPSALVLGQVRNTGNEFFDLNFPSGRYGTEDLSFVMTLEEDFAISGVASAVLPTAVMSVFGKQTIPITVECESRMNFTNLDIMMVLDVTGSMRHTNAGDTLSRIDSLRSVVKNFHSNLEVSKSPETRIRYGFVPYATNVNVGAIMEDEWVADDWTYQSREVSGTGTETTTPNNHTGFKTVSGTRSDWTTISSYAATPNVPDGTDNTGGYYCDGTQPDNTLVETFTFSGTTYTVPISDPDGTEVREDGTKNHNGKVYRTIMNGSTCEVQERTDDNFLQSFYVIRERTVEKNEYTYKPISHDVSMWRSWVPGCMEERKTYDIADYTNVDLTQALDLDIDLVPGANISTKWRPHFPHHVYAREISDFDASGSFTLDPVTTEEEFADVGWWWFSDCPVSPVRKLDEMTADDLDTYLATLQPQGATYHDIGMLWGARLLTPDGIFAAENADETPQKPTTRHLIFLTDGQTEPYDLAYSAYGVEPLDRRRWNPDTSSFTLAQTVESRFLFACNEIKKKNTTVWVIAFGTTVNDAMTQCAGAGHYFEASNATQLDDAFSSIARSLGDLRVSK